MYRGLESLQNGLNELFDTWFVVGISGFDLTLSDDAADSHSLMAHVKCKTCDAGTFHFVVGDTLTFVAERGDAFVDIRYSQVNT